jgi:hypothetical protein
MIRGREKLNNIHRGKVNSGKENGYLTLFLIITPNLQQLFPALLPFKLWTEKKILDLFADNHYD